MHVTPMTPDPSASIPTLPSPPAYTVGPFALLLVSIAVLPLLPRVAHWWERNLSKFMVSTALGCVGIAMLWFTRGGSDAWHAVGHAAEDFIPFIVLLGSLYVIAGGILITGSPKASPIFNTGVLALGAVLANVLGTTGASMVLIRPLLRANQQRKYRVHTVVFFIFVVSNMGGLLLPIGDPPLFLGYLRGVPFTWTLELWHVWVTAVGCVLLVHLALDTVLLRRARAAGATPPPEPGAPEVLEADQLDPLRFAGALNVLWLLGVVWATAVLVPGNRMELTGWKVSAGAREAVTIFCALASLATTPAAVRKQNHFTWGPIVEVAALFGGLFLAMQPALELLVARGSALGMDTPAELFWATGVLSSFLDNAPTYLVFAQVAAAITPSSMAGAVPFESGAIAPALLAAVSTGAVFMGANTYIGNGPNLMVAAIARSEGVRMPTFFGYMAWSAGILLPLFAVLTWLFFWG